MFLQIPDLIVIWLPFRLSIKEVLTPKPFYGLTESDPNRVCRRAFEMRVVLFLPSPKGHGWQLRKRVPKKERGLSLPGAMVVDERGIATFSEWL